VPGAHPAFYIMGTGSFPGVKRPWRDADHPPSSAEVKEIVQLYLYSPSGPSWPALGWNLPLRLHSKYYNTGWLFRKLYTGTIMIISPNIFRMINWKKMWQTGRVERRKDSRNVYGNLVETPEWHLRIKVEQRLCFTLLGRACVQITLQKADTWI
jgi:hypothetical protein